MGARYAMHRLINGLQRGKMLETQAKQEQVLPVTVPEAVPVAVPQAVPEAVPVATLAEEVTVPRRIPPHHRRTASVRLSASDLPRPGTSLGTPSHGGSDETPAPLEISPKTTTTREQPDFTDHARDVSDDTPHWRTMIYSLVLGLFNIWAMDPYIHNL